jgi:dihydroorotase
MSIVVKGGQLIDRDGVRDGLDLVVDDGVIAAVGADLDGDTVVDAGGCVVGPGLVDLHAHLRQPGLEEAETIETGSRAAALGGFTAVVAMPNTTPAIDCAAVVREVQDLGRDALCDIEVSGAITVGRAGEQLAPMAEMVELGVRIFTDDGTGVQDPAVMRRAMEYASDLGVRLAQHCEDRALAGAGVMHEGEWSSRLGLPGQPAEAEELMVMRDIALCRLTGCPIHFQHLSTQRSVAMVGAARAEGLDVTAEACPHHFTLTHAQLASYDPLFKVNPPLRTESDVEAVIDGLRSGVVDAVATDHAPHTPESKERPLDQAPPGMLGLETALPLALERLDLPLVDLMARMSWVPAGIACIDDRHGGPLREGRPANIVVFDPTATWTVDPDALASRARNTPYAGREVTGKVRHTIRDGELVVHDGEAQR